MSLLPKLLPLNLVTYWPKLDTAKFKSHSTRSAAVSAANQAGIPMDTILSAAGWSNTRTFDQFYNKNITEQGLFANTVLDAVVQGLN